MRAYHETYGLPTLLTNCSNNYGPYQFPEKLIPLMILNALEGRPLPIYGDGGNVRDWLHVEDHCRGHSPRAAAGAARRAKYNLGGRQRAHQPADRRRALRGAGGEPAGGATTRRSPAGASPPTGDLKTFVADRPGHDRRYAIDDAKIRAELGWAPARLRGGPARTVRWYLDHRAWCEAVQSGRYGRERLGVTGAEPDER